MCPINKLGPADGRRVEHRFSCPHCGYRLTVYRRIRSLLKYKRRMIKTYLVCCRRISRIRVPSRKACYPPMDEDQFNLGDP